MGSILPKPLPGAECNNMVNTGQQVGGSVGTALLSTLAASATTAAAATRRST